VTTLVRSGWTGDHRKKLYRNTVEMEQMLERLQAEMRTNREEMGAGQGLRKEEMRAGQELLKEEMMSKLDAHHERMTAKMISWIEEMEASPEKSDAVAEHEEVPKEEAMVEAIGALEDRYGYRHLDVGHLC
jgi:hypothetical protein